MAVARTIVGPQQQFERSGAQSLRDIRPFTTRLSEGLRGSGSGLLLAIGAGATWFEPAVIDLAVPLSALYALWVLTRTPRLPMRLPKSAYLPDRSNPQPGSRKPRPANGTIFIGWDHQGHELWVTADDARQHITIPGTTGAGKTTAILSLLTNALIQGSGFVLVDGKGDRGLFGEVLAMAMARRFGRDDDVRLLNFMVASGARDSHSFNPFAIGNADALRELLASQLGEQTQNDTNGVFRERAVALVGTIAPVLVWLRDYKGVILNIETIRFSIELRWIWKLAMEKIVLLRDPETGTVSELDVSAEVPEDITWPLRSYLGELPGFDPTMPLEKQKGDEPSKQHGFAQFYFTATFTQLAVSLGHIFRVDCGDIDMRDVVLNRRILVVSLPALENSDATLAALGKLVVASLRAMMAQLLGGSVEGTYSEADKPGMGPSPYFVVLDELAYYATSGLDRMLAQGRSLNVSFMLGFQEISGIWARLGEKTASLLGNANLTIAMRQQDGGRTREWIEKTAGQTYVTQATSYQGADDGAYREARHADIRQVSRVDWNDLTSLIEGEAIVLFGGRRIYARVFHARVDDAGPKRLGRTVTLTPPDRERVRARMRRLAEIGAMIERGDLVSARGEDPSLVIDALRDGFIAAARANASSRECAAAALATLADLPESALPPRPPPPEDGTPVTAVTPMLNAAAQEPILDPSNTEIAGATGSIGEAGGRPSAGSAALVQSLTRIERLAGMEPLAARSAAM
ncbi:MAG: type IV secretion system DNA-binding domain-containing protein, partial [Acetobacteraceae bacterium]|nr:type IV secretion system DNA-binding domain-containing protein [Acetobacteraceae bacterium]